MAARTPSVGGGARTGAPVSTLRHSPGSARIAHLAALALAACVGWMCSCASVGAPVSRLAAEWSALSASPAELALLAEETLRTTRSPGAMARAAVAVEKAYDLATGAERGRIAELGCRVYIALSERMGEREWRSLLARRAVNWVARGRRASPDERIWDYHEGAAWGLIASSDLAPGRSLQERVEAPLLKLVDSDEGAGIEQGGSLRILGTLYVSAPPWPAGVGDIDEGFALLERAVHDYAGHPLNHFFIAKAYAKVGHVDAARKAFRRMLAFPREGEWAIIGGPFRLEARQLLRDLRTR